MWHKQNKQAEIPKFYLPKLSDEKFAKFSSAKNHAIQYFLCIMISWYVWSIDTLICDIIKDVLYSFNFVKSDSFKEFAVSLNLRVFEVFVRIILRSSRLVLKTICYVKAVKITCKPVN